MFDADSIFGSVSEALTFAKESSSNSSDSSVLDPGEVVMFVVQESGATHTYIGVASSTNTIGLLVKLVGVDALATNNVLYGSDAGFYGLGPPGG
jgi:hypothetical protein